jgi:hypothetical protein
MTIRIHSWRPAPDVAGPVSCDVCGCRLMASGDGDGWQHYPSPDPTRDARGCRPICVDRIHDRSGHALEDMIPA